GWRPGQRLHTLLRRRWPRRRLHLTLLLLRRRSRWRLRGGLHLALLRWRGPPGWGARAGGGARQVWVVWGGGPGGAGRGRRARQVRGAAGGGGGGGCRCCGGVAPGGGDGGVACGGVGRTTFGCCGGPPGGPPGAPRSRCSSRGPGSVDVGGADGGGVIEDGGAVPWAA